MKSINIIWLGWTILFGWVGLSTRFQIFINQHTWYVLSNFFDTHNRLGLVVFLDAKDKPRSFDYEFLKFHFKDYGDGKYGLP